MGRCGESAGSPSRSADKEAKAHRGPCFGVAIYVASDIVTFDPGVAI